MAHFGCERMAQPLMPPVHDTVAAADPGGGWFFAIPFDAIAGFEEVAETARSLATLPAGLDLERYSGVDVGPGRRRLLAPPDVERMSFLERRSTSASALRRHVQRIEAARGEGPANSLEKHEWRIGPTCYYMDHPSPRIAPLRRSMARFFGGECRCLADQFYPPGAFRRWHTDRWSGYLGWEVFLVEVAQAGRSSFRYVDPRTGEMVVVPDRNDVAYFFRVTGEEPLFWHGVLCEDTFRWSQGFQVPRDWRSRIRFGTPEGA